MQDCYNVVKCLQDLACLDATTASLFFECNGFSNLSALLSWPEADMRHARWAAAVVLKDVRPTHFFLTFVLIASERRTLIWKRDRPACPIEAGQLPFQNTKKESRHARQSERQSKGESSQAGGMNVRLSALCACSWLLWHCPQQGCLIGALQRTASRPSAAS